MWGTVGRLCGAAAFLTGWKFDAVSNGRGKEEVTAVNGPRVTRIAVIGMACRLPGGINSPEQLWEALVHGDDMVTEIPTDRWIADEYYDPERGVPGRSVCRWGGFLEDIGGFDADFF